MKKTLLFILEVIKIVVIALAIVIPIRYFLFQPFVVNGQSMEPNFSDGNYLIIDELSYRLREPHRGEVIVFESPVDSTRLIKRIIGLPGETIQIENDKIKIYNNDNYQILDETEYLPEEIQTIGDVKIVLNENEYFVLGDNRLASYDSRRFGPIFREDIIGRVYLRVWPFDFFDRIKTPAY